MYCLSGIQASRFLADDPVEQEDAPRYLFHRSDCISFGNNVPDIADGDHPFTACMKRAMLRPVKAIAGCNSDNIPGVRGIGEKIASAYILGEAKPMAVAKIEASMDTIKETLRLVKLPFEGTPDLEFIPDALNYDAFMRMSAEIGAISLSDGYWKRFFNGEV